MSLSRPGETEPIHCVSYGHVAACQLMGPHTLALRVGESQLLLQSPQVSRKRVWKVEGTERMSRNILLNTEHGAGTVLGTGDLPVIKERLKELTLIRAGVSDTEQGIKNHIRK